MEVNLQKNRDSFKRKIPETEKDLAMLRHLVLKKVRLMVIPCGINIILTGGTRHQEEGEDLQTHFNLADNVYAKATVDSAVGKVCIWLGVRPRAMWGGARIQSFDGAFGLTVKRQM
jgi:hypothetical protein